MTPTDHHYTKKQSYLISETGSTGPRVDILLQIFARIEEFEEELKTGRRIIVHPNTPIENNVSQSYNTGDKQ